MKSSVKPADLYSLSMRDNEVERRIGARPSISKLNINQQQQRQKTKRVEKKNVCDVIIILAKVMGTGKSQKAKRQKVIKKRSYIKKHRWETVNQKNQ